MPNNRINSDCLLRCTSLAVGYSAHMNDRSAKFSSHSCGIHDRPLLAVMQSFA